jgi:hypothetical protein
VTFTPNANSTAAGSISVATGAFTDAAGNANADGGDSDNAVSFSIDTIVPTVHISGPSGIVTSAFDVTIVFSDAVVGFDVNDITVSNGSVTVLAGSATTYTASVEPELGRQVTVTVLEGVASDGAGNLNSASNVFAAQAGSPASAFASYEPELQQIVQDEAARTLRTNLSFNTKLVRSARERLIDRIQQSLACEDEESGCGEDAPSNTTVPLDVVGDLNYNNTVLSTSGTFHGQRASHGGAQKRLAFGDFDIQHDTITGSTTATVTASVGWESSVTDKSVLGYFIKGDLAHSNIASTTFSGDNQRYGVDVGGYAVHQLNPNTYVDFFATLGFGRNTLGVANDAISLDGNYETRTATIGGFITGVIERKKFQLRPEFSFKYAKAWVSRGEYAGAAYGQVDEDLYMDSSTVSVAQLSVRPEIKIALDQYDIAQSSRSLSVAPRFFCEVTRGLKSNKDCGAGVDLSINGVSTNASSRYSANVSFERIEENLNAVFSIQFDREF